MKVRVVRFGSTAESTTRFRKVTVAVGAVWVGRAEGVVGRLLDTDPTRTAPHSARTRRNAEKLGSGPGYSRRRIGRCPWIGTAPEPRSLDPAKDTATTTATLAATPSHRLRLEMRVQSLLDRTGTADPFGCPSGEVDSLVLAVGSSQG